MSSPQQQSSQTQSSSQTVPIALQKSAEPIPSSSDSAPSLIPAPALASDRFWFGAFLIFMLGIVLRQINLGTAPFHPDEAIHAYFSQNFNTYKYDPVYHGPLLYHLTSFLLTLFGQYDYTARLMPSLMGIILLMMVFLPARRWMGARGALAATGLLALSPSIITYSRHLLHDALVLVLTFGSVLCFAGMWTHPANTNTGRNLRLGLAAFLTLFLATKANCFFIMVMLLAFYVAWRGAGLFKIPVAAARLVPPLCFLAVSIAAIVFPVAFINISTPNVAATPEHATFQGIVLGSCAWMWLWLLTRAPDEAEKTAKASWLKTSDITTYILFGAVCMWLYFFLFGNVAQVLQQWAQTRSFPVETYREGTTSAQTAISRMLEYWGGQQKKPRLPGRHDYYIVLALLYEVPILLATIGGVWHFARNRTAWTDLLLWWAFTSWAVYAVANEKVPWLLVHMMLPFALLGGMWLGQIRWKKPILAIAMVLGFVFSGRGAIAMIFERAGDNAEPILYAQTPDVFRDAINDALIQTQTYAGALGMANDRQWPSVWYFRRSNPLNNGSSTQSIGNSIDLKTLRVMVGQTANDDKDVPDPTKPHLEVKEELAMRKAGWDVKTVDFLIWPRVRWSGTRPDRYWRWWWTRDTLPQSERAKPQSEWNISILSGDGEWSSAQAVIGHVKK